MNVQDRFIAAVAGSAGSQDALMQLFEHAPHDDVSFVVLRHMPAGFMSQLGFLLTGHSPLRVVDIVDGMTLENDTIYIAPSGMYVTIRGHVFSVWERPGGVNRTADVFMTSLAANSGIRAIAVVLSGTMTDGSEGVRMVRMAGGLTLAQDPATAEFPSMPSAAIGTGCVAKVLPSSEMAPVIHAYVQAVQRSAGGALR